MFIVRGGARGGATAVPTAFENLSPPVGERLTIRRGNSSRKLVYLTNKLCKK